MIINYNSGVNVMYKTDQSWQYINLMLKICSELVDSTVIQSKYPEFSFKLFACYEIMFAFQNPGETESDEIINKEMKFFIFRH